MKNKSMSITNWQVIKMKDGVVAIFRHPGGNWELHMGELTIMCMIVFVK